MLYNSCHNKQNFGVSEGHRSLHLLLSTMSSLQQQGLPCGAICWLPFFDCSGEQAIPMEPSLGPYAG